MASDLKELDSCDCRHMAATTQIKMFEPNKRGSMTVKVMSYRVLRQHTLRFGYVCIKQWQYPNYQPNKFSTFRLYLNKFMLSSACKITIFFMRLSEKNRPKYH